MSDALDDWQEDAPEQVRVRKEKLERLREAGADPYPVGYPRSAKISAVWEKYQDLDADEHTGDHVAVVGRIMLYRTGGKLCFATIRDDTGQVQVMLSLDRVGEHALQSWKTDVDLGDHVGITGEVITSKRGELSVLAESWTLTSKALRPLPDKHHGLTDPEARVRQRYVDLIVNPEARRMVQRRGEAIQAIRSTLLEREFLEVETPMLQPVHGGATARPFTTHVNAYNLDLYLRIAPELYLKRLVVGGIEKVFEINRVFRNEGADSTHNPEFSMLEWYQSYGDYNTGMDITQDIVRAATIAVFGDTVIRNPTHGDIDVGSEWPSVTLHGSVSEALGREITPRTPVDSLREHAEERGLSYDPDWGPGKLVEHLFEELVEPHLIQPTFVRDFPVETSPLTRQHRDDSLLTEKWDLIGFGMELGTCFSELTDPVEQRRRLTEQSLLAADGDPEAMELDEDFLRALEHGMPPTVGAGLGIDRLLMAFTGQGIRETILFPMVKPT